MGDLKLDPSNKNVSVGDEELKRSIIEAVEKLGGNASVMDVKRNVHHRLHIPAGLIERAIRNMTDRGLIKFGTHFNIELSDRDVA